MVFQTTFLSVCNWKWSLVLCKTGNRHKRQDTKANKNATFIGHKTPEEDNKRTITGINTTSIPTLMTVSVPLLLHGDLKAAVQDLVQRVDPILHLPFAIGSQQVGALILHLQLESKPPDLVILQHGVRSDKMAICVLGRIDWNAAMQNCPCK